MKKLVFHLFLGAFCLQGICQTTDSFKDFTMTDGFNVIELANKIITVNDFDKSRTFILDTQNFSFKKDYETVTFLSADRTDGFKERFWMSRQDKSSPSIAKVNVTVRKVTDDDINRKVLSLGYTLVSSKENDLLGSHTVTRVYKNPENSIEVTFETTSNGRRIKRDLTFLRPSTKLAGKNTNETSTVENRKDTDKQVGRSKTTEANKTSGIPNVNEKKFKVKNVEFAMRFVPHGTFTMGKDNNTLKVELSNDYWVSETEVTTGLYDAVMDTHIGGTGQMAVICTWLMAMEFVRRLNIITGYNFRIITEAEWEYAARYGNGTMKYSGSNNPKDVLNTRDVKDSSPEALNKPNKLGIYGMSNKTSEWCYDIYQEYYPKKSNPQRNYQGPSGQGMRGNEHNHVVRSGGAMYYRQNSDTDLFHRTSEYEGGINLGIRLALYDNDVNNKNPQKAIDKKKVNLPTGMPVKWRGTGTLSFVGKSKSAIKATIFIKDERHNLTTPQELEGKVGYGYVYLGETKDKGYYIIEKINVTGKNTFNITIVPADGGQRKQLTLTYVFKTSTWKLLKCKSAFKIFNDAAFTYVD